MGQAFSHFYNDVTIWDWYLLIVIPGAAISGFVQEGAKILPVWIWRRQSGLNITPQLGMALGAVAGAGVGIFESFWIFGQMFGAGWTVDAISTDGFMGIAGFWERFFVLAFHIALSSLAGYGIATGKGWKFWAIAGGLHALLNYAAAFYSKGHLSLVQVETVIALFGVLATVAVVLLRLRLNRDNMLAVESATEEAPPAELPPDGPPANDAA